jgi:hypothetical protein
MLMSRTSDWENTLNLLTAVLETITLKFWPLRADNFAIRLEYT